MGVSSPDFLDLNETGGIIISPSKSNFRFLDNCINNSAFSGGDWQSPLGDISPPSGQIEVRSVSLPSCFGSPTLKFQHRTFPTLILSWDSESQPFSSGVVSPFTNFKESEQKVAFLIIYFQFSATQLAKFQQPLCYNKQTAGRNTDLWQKYTWQDPFSLNIPKSCVVPPLLQPQCT